MNLQTKYHNLLKIIKKNKIKPQNPKIIYLKKAKIFMNPNLLNKFFKIHMKKSKIINSNQLPTTAQN